MDATRTQEGPVPTSSLDRGPIRLGKPSRPPSIHCGTLKGRTAPGRHPRMPPRTRKRPPATTSPPLGIQETPCQSARPDKGVTPRHKVPLHPLPHTMPGASDTHPCTVGRVETLPYRLRAAGVCSRGLLSLPTLGLSDPLGIELSPGQSRGCPGTLLASDPPRRSSRGLDPRYCHSGSLDHPSPFTMTRWRTPEGFFLLPVSITCG